MSYYKFDPTQKLTDQEAYRSILSQSKKHIFSSHQGLTDVCFPCGGATPDMKSLNQMFEGLNVHSLDLDAEAVLESVRRSDQFPNIKLTATCSNALDPYVFPVGSRSLLCNFFSLTTFDPEKYETLLANAFKSVPKGTPNYYLFHDVTGSQFTSENGIFSAEVTGARFSMTFPEANRFDSKKIGKEWCFNQGMFSLAAAGKEVNYYCLDIDTRRLPAGVKPAVVSLCLAVITEGGGEHTIPGWKLRGAPPMPINAAKADSPRFVINLNAIPIYLPGDKHIWDDTSMEKAMEPDATATIEPEKVEESCLYPEAGDPPPLIVKRRFEDLALCYMTLPDTNHKIPVQTFLNKPLPLSNSFHPLPYEVEEYIEWLGTDDKKVCSNCREKTPLIVAMNNPNRPVDYCYPCVGYYTREQLLDPDPMPRETQRILDSGIRPAEAITRALRTSTSQKEERLSAWQGCGPDAPISPLHQFANTEVKVPGLFIMPKKHFPPVLVQGASRAAVEEHHTRTAYHWGYNYRGEGSGFVPLNSIPPDITNILEKLERNAGIQVGLFNQLTHLVYHPTAEKGKQALMHHRDAKGLCGPILVQNGDSAAMLQMKEINSGKEYNYAIGPGDSYLMTGMAVTHFSHAVTSRFPHLQRDCHIARHIGSSDDISTGKNMRVPPSTWLMRDESKFGIPPTQGVLMRSGQRFKGAPPRLVIPAGQPLPAHRKKAPECDQTIFRGEGRSMFTEKLRRL